MAVSAHGRDDATPRGLGSEAVEAVEAGGGITAPAGFPQRWQKLAPGESVAPHLAQVVVSRVAPQLAQKRPDPGVPQTEQTVSGGVGGVMAYNLHRPYRARRLLRVFSVRP